jgi:uncharacterized integral membrane protein
MKLSWVLPILLLVFVAVFSVQNAEPITVRFLAWQATVSAALVIQLAALLGGLVGLTAGAWSRRARYQGEPAGSPTTPRHDDGRKEHHASPQSDRSVRQPPSN